MSEDALRDTAGRRSVQHDPAEPIIELQGVQKLFVKGIGLAERIHNAFGGRNGVEVVRAVDDVSFSVEAGEVVGLAGESGCGKSTLGRIIADLSPPTAGEVRFRGVPRENTPPGKRMQESLKIQMVFQDPFASLNPRMKVRKIIANAPLYHGLITPAEVDDLVDEMMLRCGLEPALRRRYPHQFSGGQRQRICIARALAVDPQFLVCDEPIASLDVSIQAQILNLFMKLRADLGLTCLFISHDLGVLRRICDRVLVMYLGRIVEAAETETLFSSPNHPYTQALLADVPRLDRRHWTFTPIRGEIPSPIDPPSGCHFHPRCPHALERCRVEKPAFREIAPGHWSACHLNDEWGRAAIAPPDS
jgi:peptide/nickel transport system ATP-binding protein